MYHRSRINYLALLIIVSALIDSINNSNLINTGLEDDLQFTFKWPGDLFNFEDDTKQNIDLIDISTVNNEKYKCAIPISTSNDGLSEQNKADKNSEETLINTSGLIENIHIKKFCSYRIESYWIYELCHGTYVKQYHETKTSGKRVITDEYYLGYYDRNKQEPDYFKNNENQMIPNVHYRTLGGERIAMYSVKYSDGTLCEVVPNMHREITVFYACDENGNDNIASFEEISSCVYEMVVVTKWICSHPSYRTPEKQQQFISCYSIGNSPLKPTLLADLEEEQIAQKSDDNKLKMTNRQGETIIVHYKTIEDENVDSANANANQQDHLNPKDVQFQYIQQPQPPQQPQQQQQQQTQQTPTPTVSDEAQKEMIMGFLSGSQCLSGGNGWWKYEVCLGRHVIQYHEDEKTRKRTNILLGTWNIQHHIDWLSRNPNKRPLANKNERSSISLLFTMGDLCEITNKNRVVEVKLRCIRTKEKSHAVSLYLVEPSVCDYLVGIESPWLCDHIENVDTNGFPGSQKEKHDNDDNAKSKP